jgi:uncharacterized protein YbaP (TraB family)
MKRIRVRLRLAVLIGLLQPISPSVALARPPVAHAAHPALWKLQNKVSTIWLFGTIHALPPHFEWEDAAIRAAIAQSDRLVLEAVIEPDQSRNTLLRMAAATAPLPPVADRVPAKFHDALAAMAAKSGAPLEALNGMKTWAAAMVLFGVTVSGLGVTSADGVEEQLKAQFKMANKPVEGLETLEQQLGFFDTMDEARQREFLVSVVDSHADDAADFGKMVGAWSHGDERGISASFDKDMKTSDALRAVLLSRRNAHWADALVRRLGMPGTQFIAVGAGHLTGPDSVQVMLAKLGYRAKRVQ